LSSSFEGADVADVVLAVVVVGVGGGMGGGGLVASPPFLAKCSVRVGVLAPSGLEEFSLRAVSIESRRVVEVLVDVTVSPRFLGPLGTLVLVITPETLRERGRETTVRPSVSSLSLSGLD
jgi:hypothetical protein